MIIAEVVVGKLLCSCVLALVAIALMIVAYDRMLIFYWLGSADLEIEFVITQVDGNKPIEGATIAVDIHEAIAASEKPFDLATDRNGTAHRVCNCRSDGCYSQLRFTDSWSVQPPYWRYQVSAAGYETSVRADVHTEENIARIQRLQPGHAKLVIPVGLRKKGEGK
jgi:hypothetical protein